MFGTAMSSDDKEELFKEREENRKILEDKQARRRLARGEI